MLAPHLAPMPGAVIVRSDVERKALFGARRNEKLSGAGLHARGTARVYAIIADKARRIVAAGHSAIVDAVFAQPRKSAPPSARSAEEPPRSPCRGCFSPRTCRPGWPGSAPAPDDASDADADGGPRPGKLRHRPA